MHFANRLNTNTISHEAATLGIRIVILRAGPGFRASASLPQPSFGKPSNTAGADMPMLAAVKVCMPPPRSRPEAQNSCLALVPLQKV
jgi:hypothetical protein